MKKDIKILTVDDDALITQQVKYHLKKSGFLNVIETYDAYSAIEILENNNIDLIISDWRMTGMSGLDFLKKVRSMPHLEDIPFLLLTVESNKSYILSAIENKVSGYILKPIEPKILLNKVHQALGIPEDTDSN